MAPASNPKIEILPSGKEEKVTVETHAIEDVTPFCPYSYPDKRCKTKGSKVLLKDSFIITDTPEKEIREAVSEAGGRIRDKNDPKGKKTK